MPLSYPPNSQISSKAVSQAACLYGYAPPLSSQTPSSTAFSNMARAMLESIRGQRWEFSQYDLSISKYKEIEYEEVAYEKPEVIMEKIEGLEDKIKVNIAELRSMLR